MTRCSDNPGAVCVVRRVPVGPSEPGGPRHAIVITDRLAPAPDGTVRWSSDFAADPTDPTSADPFRLVLGTSAMLGAGAADRYWLPRAMAPPPPPPASPFPQPSLVPCSQSTSSPSAEAVDASMDPHQLWQLNGSGYPAGTVFSVGAQRCMLTWAPGFSPSGCSAAPAGDEYAVFYECSRHPKATPAAAAFGACPRLGNQVWALDPAGRLVNTGVPPGIHGDQCLDPSLPTPMMAGCVAGASQRWQPRAAVGPMAPALASRAAAVQLESVSRPGMCLSALPPGSRPGPDGSPSALDMQSAPAALSFGAENFLANIAGAGETRGRDAVPVPVAVFANVSVGATLAVVLAMNDTTLAAAIDASTAGLEVRRYNNRLGGGRPAVRFVVHLVAKPATDWRPAYSWVVDRYAQFFRAGPAAASVAAGVGLGMYTCANVTGLNVTALAAMGANVIWDAHFWWPYQGLFLPPVPSETTRWRSNTGGGEEIKCPGFNHGQEVSIAAIRTAASTLFLKFDCFSRISTPRLGHVFLVSMMIGC